MIKSVYQHIVNDFNIDDISQHHLPQNTNIELLCIRIYTPRSLKLFQHFDYKIPLNQRLFSIQSAFRQLNQKWYILLFLHQPPVIWIYHTKPQFYQLKLGKSSEPNKTIHRYKLVLIYFGFFATRLDPKRLQN